MAKEAVLQVRMDAALKESADTLFRNMGTSFAEVVRMMAQKSVDIGGIPFALTKTSNDETGFGCLQKYANPELIPLEKEAWANAAAEKHGKNSH